MTPEQVRAFARRPSDAEVEAAFPNPPEGRFVVWALPAFELAQAFIGLSRNETEAPVLRGDEWMVLVHLGGD